MKKEILSPSERKKIRSDIYSATCDEPPALSDKKISFFVRNAHGKKVLDLGCVDHNEQNWMSRYWLHKAIRLVAKHTVGLDYYGPGVRRLNEIGFNVIEADAQSFELDEKFEVVTAGDLIEHLPNLEGFFLSVHNALIDDGIFVVTTPNPWCWKYMFYHFFYKKLTPVNREHVSWFCLQTLENLSARFGFEIIEHEYSSRRIYERIIPLPEHIKHTTLGIVFHKKLVQP